MVGRAAAHLFHHSGAPNNFNQIIHLAREEVVWHLASADKCIVVLRYAWLVVSGLREQILSDCDHESGESAVPESGVSDRH